MEDPIFTYGILNQLVESKIRFRKIIFLDNPSITVKRVFSLFLVYGPKNFIEFVGAYLWWNICKGGRVKLLFESRGEECGFYKATELNEVIKLMERESPDLIVSVNCNIRLPNLLLEKSKFGGINLHQGSLPNYKGLMPIFYSQLAGEKMVGSTVHVMNSQFDSGEILIQKEIQIFPGENYVKIWKKLNIVGSFNLAEVLRYFDENGSLPPSKRQEVSGSYYGLPSLKLVINYFFLQLKNKLLAFKRWSE